MLYNNFMLMLNAFENLGIGGYICLGFFFVFAVLQLVFAFLEKEKYRRIVKPFLLIALAIMEIVVVPNHPLLYVAALLDCAGDILVLNRDEKTFLVGSASFLLGHICYLVEALVFIVGLGNIHYPFFIMLPVFFGMIVYLSYRCFFVKHTSKAEGIGGGFYLAVLCLFIPVFLLTSVKVGGFMWLAFVGGLLFIASDAIIIYSKYINKFKRSDFYIMIFYMIAQLLISLGFILTIVG